MGLVRQFIRVVGAGFSGKVLQQQF